MHDSDQVPQLAQLGMLATAVAGREVGVGLAAPGVAAWTNGSTVFVQGDAAPRLQLRQLCAQSALIAAGSLHPDILRQLARRPGLAPRYLAIEGHRALSAVEGVLPPLVLPQLNRVLAARSAAPAESLKLAMSRELLPVPSALLGSIRPRELLAAQQRAGGTAAAGQHLPREEQRRPLQEQPDDANADTGHEEDAGSPVGGGGGIGRLLQKLMQSVRRLQGGDSPGADTATHRSRSGPRAGVRSLQSTLKAEHVDGVSADGAGIRYPEWDVHRRAYREDWCTVQELDPPVDTPATVDWLDGHGLRKPLSRLGMGLERLRRQAQGDDIDIDAAVEAELEARAGRLREAACYIDSRRLRRDLSVLVLLDISGSVTQAAASGPTVHQQQRRVAATLCTVLYEVGDRVAIYAFNSQGRGSVQLTAVKRFDETLSSLVMRRLHSLVPGAYSRLGAAIRHATRLLRQRSGTPRKLLVVLSDGLAYDHGYEPAYGAADARQALAEARSDGVGCLCLSIGADTDTAVLRRVVGSAAHATVARPEQLGRAIGPLFRAALRAAEVQRRVA